MSHPFRLRASSEVRGTNAGERSIERNSPRGERDRARANTALVKLIGQLQSIFELDQA